MSKEPQGTAGTNGEDRNLAEKLKRYEGKARQEIRERIGPEVHRASSASTMPAEEVPPQERVTQPHETKVRLSPIIARALREAMQTRQPKADKVKENAMTEPTREEFNAKLEAAEARLDSKVERVASSVEIIAAAVQSMRDDMGTLKADMADTRRSARNTNWNVWIVAVGFLALTIGIVTFGVDVASLVVDILRPAGGG